MNTILLFSLPVAGIVLGWTIRWLYARFQLSASEQKAELVQPCESRQAEGGAGHPDTRAGESQGVRAILTI